MTKRYLTIIIFILSCLTVMAGQQKRFTLMGFGDSITEGGEGFESYLYALWERLFSAGYDFDFIGPHESECRIGKLANCGFRGKNAEYLDRITDSIYQAYPADYVLIHAGHNYYAHQEPVARIIKSYRSIIHKMQQVNPHVHILLSTVVESGKLPKYSYIPQLNHAIVSLVKDLHSTQVTLVDMNANFDWHTMTIADKVHPNSVGRNYMGEVWFKAIKSLLKKPVYHFDVKKIGYKRLRNGEQLEAHVFLPHGKSSHSAICWFFAGGWKYGTPLQFYRECSYFADKGMVAVTFDYRIACKDSTTAEDAVEDCKDAISWLRTNTSFFNIKPYRIAVAGASAGGSMAALLGCIDPQSTENLSRPDLLILEYPTLQLSENKLRPQMPPMVMLIGTKDEFTTIDRAKQYVNKIKELGNDCTLHTFEKRHHPIFYYRKPLTDDYTNVLEIIDAFLKKYQFTK